MIFAIELRPPKTLTKRFKVTREWPPERFPLGSSSGTDLPRDHFTGHVYSADAIENSVSLAVGGGIDSYVGGKLGFLWMVGTRLDAEAPGVLMSLVISSC